MKEKKREGVRGKKQCIILYEQTHTATESAKENRAPRLILNPSHCIEMRLLVMRHSPLLPSASKNGRRGGERGGKR